MQVSTNLDHGCRSASNDKTLLRKASCLLSTFSVPFRHSLSMDRTQAGSDVSHYHRQSSRRNLCPQWNKPDDGIANQLEIMVQTSTHTSCQHLSHKNGPQKVTPCGTTITQTTGQTGIKSQLKSYPSHYQKARTVGQSFKQSYILASQNLRSDDYGSQDRILLDAEIQPSSNVHYLQPACARRSPLSPVWAQPISPQSETSKNQSERSRSYSLGTPIHASFTTSPDENVCSMGVPVSDDYASWIKFETPVDLLSPTFSNPVTSPSASSEFSLESPIDQHPASSIPMIREISQSYCGGTPNFVKPLQESHSQFLLRVNSGISSSPGLYVDSAFSFNSHPNETKHEKSFRKKISQTFQDTFKGTKN